MTLSVWADLESVAAFSYRGAHGEALSYRKDWFERGPCFAFNFRQPFNAEGQPTKLDRTLIGA